MLKKLKDFFYATLLVGGATLLASPFIVPTYLEQSAINKAFRDSPYLTIKKI